MRQSYIEFSVRVSCEVFQDEDGIFISSCPSLDVFSQGCTKEKAQEN